MILITVYITLICHIEFQENGIPYKGKIAAFTSVLIASPIKTFSVASIKECLGFCCVIVAPIMHRPPATITRTRRMAGAVCYAPWRFNATR